MVINDCILLRAIATFHFFRPLRLHRAADLWLWGRSEKVFVLVANGLFVFMMRGEDGEVIWVDSRPASSQREPPVDRPLTEVTGKSSGNRFDSDLHPCWKNPNKLEEQNNTQREINHIND